MAPNRPLAARLGRHFAACTVVTVAAANHAHAEVIYSGVRDLNVPSTTNGLYLNVLTGAFNETGGSGTTVPGWDLNLWSATTLNFFNPAAPTGGVYARVSTATAGVSNLPANTPIGPATLWASGAAQTVGSNPFVLNSATNIVGFRFRNENGGTTHYGWARVRLAGTLSAQPRTLVDWAIESTPDTPILAGNTGGPPPAYDPCANTNPTVSVGSNLVPYRVDTVAGLSACGGTIPAANYYKFTSIDAGVHTFETCPTAGSAQIAVLSACDASASVLGCGTSACGGSGSSVSVTLAAATTVYVVVGGTSLGNTVPVLVAAPPIAACVNAVSAPFGTSPFTNEGITADQVVRASATGTPATIHKAAWYKFVPGVNGLYTFSLCGSVNDTKMAIGTVCPSTGQTFNSLAYNDDTCPCTSGCGTTTQSSYSSKMGEGQTTGIVLNTELTAGTTYYVVVGGFGATTAAVSGNLEITGPPQPSCQPDLNDDNFVNGDDLGILLGQWGACSTSCSADFNGDGFVNGDDLGVMLGAWGACP